MNIGPTQKLVSTYHVRVIRVHYMQVSLKMAATSVNSVENSRIAEVGYCSVSF